MIKTTNANNIACTHRIQLAQNIWDTTRKNIPEQKYQHTSKNNTMECHSKINTDIRLTHTRTKQNRNKKLETFAFKCTKRMIEPDPKEREKNISQAQTYQKLQIPTIQSWLEKMAIVHHLRQTRNDWNIHTETQTRTQRQEQKCKNKWQTHKNIHQNPQNLTTEQKNYLTTHIYMQQSPKKRENYIQKLFIANKDIPDKTHSLRKNKEKYGPSS